MLDLRVLQLPSYYGIIFRMLLDVFLVRLLR